MLSWRLSNRLSADFCAEALRDALDHHGRPEILNTDQGAQFACEVFVQPLRDKDVRISMDGRGRGADNVSVERLRLTLNHEDICVRCYGNPRQLREGLARFFRYYNEQRTHGTLGYHTPVEVHRGQVQWNPGPGRSPSDPAAPPNATSILTAGGPPAEKGLCGSGKTKFTQPWFPPPMVLELGSTSPSGGVCGASSSTVTSSRSS
ncbi:MAG: transposase [Victivallales bacterium]|nr:transposase [Victivallales bacterium]